MLNSKCKNYYLTISLEIVKNISTKRINYWIFLKYLSLYFNLILVFQKIVNLSFWLRLIIIDIIDIFNNIICLIKKLPRLLFYIVVMLL